MKTWLTFLMCSAYMASFSQKQDANWVFGNNCGLLFNTSGIVLDYPTSAHTMEVAASISDSFGKLMFYVGSDTLNNHDNPYNIYGFDNMVIENGDSIKLNSSSTNGAVFIPLDSDYYLLIHTGLDENCLGVGAICYGLFKSEIRMSNGQWKAVSKNQRISNLLVNEKLAITKHASGKSWWLLSQVHAVQGSNLCTGDFLLLDIYKDTILLHVQSINDPWCGIFSQFGEMVFSKSGDRLACAISNENNLRLFSFNRCNGLLSDYRTIALNGNRNPYGVEFSPSEQIIYVSFGPENGPEGLLQIYEKNGQDTVHKIWDYSERGSPGQLQLAPDGKIYLSSIFGNYFIDDTVNKHLTVINEPDSIGLACSLSVLGFFVGDSCRTRGGLPNMPNYSLGPLPVYIADAGIDTFYCAADTSIKGVPIGGDSIHGITYQWQPAPGIDGINSPTQIVKPPQSRWYNVTITDTTYSGPSCASRLDSVYIEVRNCTGIAETTTLQANLYPNPATNTLTIELPGDSEGRLTLYNLLGQEVFGTATQGRQTTVGLSLSPGLYVYRITQGTQHANGKLLVE